MSRLEELKKKRDKLEEEVQEARTERNMWERELYRFQAELDRVNEEIEELEG